MTKWQEFPLRPQGRPWVGINTRGGKLDDGTGQMEESSINTIINNGDRLEKRKGLIRGIDERFSGSVCGLHKYTDQCGLEWLLVVDEGGVSIRQPFDIPTFRASDAYPSDSFQFDGNVDPNFWTNTDIYIQSGGSLVLRGGTNGGDMRWFKDASNFSYQLTAEYALNGDSTIVLVIKQAAGTARIEGRLTNLSGTVTAEMAWIDINGAETLLGSVEVGTELAGTATLAYAKNFQDDTFTLQFFIQDSEGTEVFVQDFDTINALDDADLGQGTSVRIERVLTSSVPKILSVQGDPL